MTRSTVQYKSLLFVVDKSICRRSDRNYIELCNKIFGQTASTNHVNFNDNCCSAIRKLRSCVARKDLGKNSSEFSNELFIVEDSLVKSRRKTVVSIRIKHSTDTWYDEHYYDEIVLLMNKETFVNDVTETIVKYLDLPQLLYRLKNNKFTEIDSNSMYTKMISTSFVEQEFLNNSNEVIYFESSNELLNYLQEHTEPSVINNRFKELSKQRASEQAALDSKYLLLYEQLIDDSLSSLYLLKDLENETAT